MAKPVWQIGVENLRADYEKAQIEQAKELLGSDYDPNYVRPEPDSLCTFVDEIEDLVLLTMLLEA